MMCNLRQASSLVGAATIALAILNAPSIASERDVAEKEISVAAAAESPAPSVPSAISRAARVVGASSTRSRLAKVHSSRPHRVALEAARCDGWWCGRQFVLMIGVGF